MFSKFVLGHSGNHMTAAESGQRKGERAAEPLEAKSLPIKSKTYVLCAVLSQKLFRFAVPSRRASAHTGAINEVHG